MADPVPTTPRSFGDYWPWVAGAVLLFLWLNEKNGWIGDPAEDEPDEYADDEPVTLRQMEQRRRGPNRRRGKV